MGDGAVTSPPVVTAPGSAPPACCDQITATWPGEMAGVYDKTGSEDTCCYSDDGGATELCILDYQCSDSGLTNVTSSSNCPALTCPFCPPPQTCPTSATPPTPATSASPIEETLGIDSSEDLSFSSVRSSQLSIFQEVLTNSSSIIKIRCCENFTET